MDINSSSPETVDTIGNKVKYLVIAVLSQQACTINDTKITYPFFEVGLLIQIVPFL